MRYCLARPITLAFLAGALVGCGGGETEGSPGAEIKGRVADGYLRGAVVFWDCNNNMTPDPDEPRTTSAEGGAYTISSAPHPKPPLSACVLRAKVPAGAIDEDSGQPVGGTFTMSARLGQPGFISPVTTVIEEGIFTEEEFRRKFPSTLPMSPSADYIAAGEAGRQVHSAARYLAIALAAVEGSITTDGEASRKESLAKAVSFVPQDAFAGPPATTAALLDFKLTGMPNSESASLEKAEFALVQSAFDGASDPRRAIVQQALDTIRRHPEAVVGNTIYWNRIPQEERSSWQSKIIGGSNGFVDSPYATSLIDSLRSGTDLALRQIDLERQKANRKVAVVVARNLTGMMLTSMESAVKILPATGTIAKTIGLSKVARIKRAAAKTAAMLARHKLLIDSVTKCGDLATHLVSIDSLGELADLSEIIDMRISLARCVAGVLQAEQTVRMIEIISTGMYGVEANVDDDLLGFIKSISDLTSIVLDATGNSVASAIYNESVGMFVTYLDARHQQNKAALQAMQTLDANLDAITRRLQSFAEATSGSVIAARLAPYIAPMHLINISVPTAAEVGALLSVVIDQKMPKEIRYLVDFGDGSPAQEWTGSANSTSTSMAHKYTSFGIYTIAVHLFDASNGNAQFPFQSQGQRINVGCPAGTTVAPEGDCVVVNCQTPGGSGTSGASGSPIPPGTPAGGIVAPKTTQRGYGSTIALAGGQGGGFTPGSTGDPRCF